VINVAAWVATQLELLGVGKRRNLEATVSKKIRRVRGRVRVVCCECIAPEARGFLVNGPETRSNFLAYEIR